MSCNICVIVQNYYPEDIRVKKEVTALIKAGKKVSVISLGNNCQPKYENKENLKIYRIYLGKKRTNIIRYIYEYLSFFIQSFIKLNILDLKENFDLIHINTLPDFLVFAAFVQKMKGKRIVLDMHEITPEFFISKYRINSGSIFIKILEFIEKMSLQFADAVITVNEPIKKIFQKRAVPNKNIEVIMNTFDSHLIKPYTKTNHHGFNCVYHGTVTEMYGLDTAIRGFAIACKNISDMKFHIIGPGPEIEYLKKLTQDLGVAESVKFYGMVPHEDIFGILEKMDLGILTPKKDIFLDLSFSTKLSEYIFLKIPVISSNLNTTMFYFGDDQILYFNSNDIKDLSNKIIYAYINRDKIKYMAECAYDEYEKIKWSIMEKRYLKIIEN